MINNDFMSDDNKTNEELLKEVKKLRQLEEDRETRRKEEAEKKQAKKRTEKRMIWGCSLIICVPFIIFVLYITAVSS